MNRDQSIPQDSADQPNREQETPSSSESSNQSASASTSLGSSETSTESVKKQDKEEEFDAFKKVADYSGGSWSEEDIKWEIEELKKEKEDLKKALSDHRENLRLLKEDVRVYAEGEVGLRLKRQVMAEEEKIKDCKEKLEKCLDKLKTKQEEYWEKLSNKAEQDELKFLAQQRRGIKREVKSENIDWFTKLDDREKLYAITLSIFNGLTYSTFHNIYEIVLEVAQANKRDEEKEDIGFNFKFPDPDFAQIKLADDSPQEIIEFVDEKHVTEIFDIMRQRYRSVLLNFLPLLKQIVEKYPDWEVRVRAALAVAEVGKTNFDRVREQALVPWAGDSRSYVRASVGYVLGYLAEEETFQPYIEKLLLDWINSPPGRDRGETWRYRWAVASACKQIGIIESEWAKDLAYQELTDLARFNDIRIVDSVIHTLVFLSLQGQLITILNVLKKWVDENRVNDKDKQAAETRSMVGVLAFIILSEIHVNLTLDDEEEINDDNIQVNDLFELIHQSEAEQGDHWQLIVMIGVRALERRLAESFFSLIIRWTQYAVDDARMQNTVRNLIIDVFVQVSPRRREQILHRLTRWERQTKDEYLAEMAASAKVKIKERILGEPPSATST